MGDKQIVAYAPDGTHTVIASEVDSNDLVVTGEGGIYFTDPPNQRVWHISPAGEKQVVAKGFRPNGVILTADGGTLVVTDSEAPHLWAYRVEKDGRLTFGERYLQPLRLPAGELTRPGSDGMTVDKAGRVYVATRSGVQMFDPTGRMGGVILKPQPGSLSNVVFGGPELKIMYATCGDKVFRRLTKTQGVRY
jgi:sugar lactone lactonase YvrE